MHSEPNNNVYRVRRRRAPNAAGRFLLIILVAASLAVAAMLIFLRLASGRGAQVDLGPGAESLSPVERIGLSAYLSFRSGDLARPAGDDPTSITFTVQPGESAADVAARLGA